MKGNTNLRNMTAIYITRGEEMLMLYRVGSRVVEPSWCGIGGHFEESELNDPYACVLRELEEETPICREMLENLQFKYVTLRLKKGEIRQNYYYFASLKDDAEVSLESDEGKLRWVPLHQVMEKEMPLTAKFMLEHYLETGRFDDKLYSGITCEEKMVFTELKEF
ncbi:MAG: NUDIX domain-containing protein [Firmicutes bacterium]|nr:NUDIX domain-containing protein [Bacillota bacterium]